MRKRNTPARKRNTTAAAPVPVKQDIRICFAIAYYASEADAATAAEIGRQRGDTYNGGYFHGMPCGRDKTWDHVDRETGQQLYAVTF